jgi:ferredoxin--NADP+ reductase
MDVARMLALDPAELDPTDTAEHALEIFKTSKIRKVIICGRRGPEHAAFTAPELRDLPKLEHTDVYIDQDQINQANLRVEQMGEVEKDLKNNLEAMRLIAEHSKKGVERNLEIRFLSTPIEIRGNTKVEEIVFAINQVKNGKVSATDKTLSIKAGLVVTAIGYEAVEYPGVKIENGRIANIAGHVEHNIYVTGWAKRGPVGVIGTNKSDAADVVDLIISGLSSPKESKDLKSVLKSEHFFIDNNSWSKINAAEIFAGDLKGKPRVKIVNRDEFFSIVKKKNK